MSSRTPGWIPLGYTTHNVPPPKKRIHISVVNEVYSFAYFLEHANIVKFTSTHYKRLSYCTSQSVGRWVGQIAAGPRQHSKSRFRVPSGPMTIFLFPRLLCVLKSGLLFNEKWGLRITGHSPSTGGDSSGHSFTNWRHNLYPKRSRYPLTMDHSNELLFRLFLWTVGLWDRY
jgi:hypothetical protein